jgi:hypothetical protein
MNVWAIILYLLEVSTFIGAAVGASQAKEGSIKFGNAGGVFGLIFGTLGFLAIYELTQQSQANHAVALGVAYAVITALALPSFFSSWAKGSTTYTSPRGLLVMLAAVIGIVLTSILAFAG